jgi:hypothetical protein
MIQVEEIPKELSDKIDDRIHDSYFCKMTCNFTGSIILEQFYQFEASSKHNREPN